MLSLASRRVASVSTPTAYLLGSSALGRHGQARLGGDIIAPLDRLSLRRVPVNPPNDRRDLGAQTLRHAEPSEALGQEGLGNKVIW